MAQDRDVLADLAPSIRWTYTTPAARGSNASLIEGLGMATLTDALVRVVTFGESPYTGDRIARSASGVERASYRD